MTQASLNRLWIRVCPGPGTVTVTCFTVLSDSDNLPGKDRLNMILKIHWLVAELFMASRGLSEKLACF